MIEPSTITFTCSSCKNNYTAKESLEMERSELRVGGLIICGKCGSDTVIYQKSTESVQPYKPKVVTSIWVMPPNTAN